MTRNRLKFPAIAAICAPLVLAVAVGGWGISQSSLPGASVEKAQFAGSHAAPSQLEQVRVSDARELKRLFVKLDYTWPPSPGPTVPRIAIDPLPDDFAWPDDIQHKKHMFFKVLMPLALAENQRVLGQREALTSALAAIQREGLPADHAAWRKLEALAQDYQVDGDLADPSVRQTLLNRVDAVPVALVLAQAANESGWGESRFAREGNNLFGVWTYQPENGIVPAGRPEGETYLVRRYESLRASVRSHIFNLNIGHAYEGLREERAAMRARGDEPDAFTLAGSLERYSIRGEEYVDEIRAIIRGNGLDRVARADLRVSATSVAAMPARTPVNLHLQVAATRVD